LKNEALVFSKYSYKNVWKVFKKVSCFLKNILFFSFWELFWVLYFEKYVYGFWKENVFSKQLPLISLGLS